MLDIRATGDENKGIPPQVFQLHLVESSQVVMGIDSQEIALLS